MTRAVRRYCNAVTLISHKLLKMEVKFDMTSREIKWSKMLQELDDGFVPKDVINYLEKAVGLSNFESKRKILSRGDNLSNDDLAEHVATAHSLINFWKNMYICASAKIAQDLDAEEENDYENSFDDDFEASCEGELDSEMRDEERPVVPTGSKTEMVVLSSDDEDPESHHRHQSKKDKEGNMLCKKKRKAINNRKSVERKRRKNFEEEKGDLHLQLRRHRCRLCHRSLVSFQHMTEKHGAEYAGACPLCEETDVEDIISHLHIVHLGNTALKCGVCSFEAFNEKTFEKHKQNHEGVKKTKCKFCPSWFPDWQSCQDHAKAVHPNERVPIMSNSYLKLNPLDTLEDSLACDVCGFVCVGRKYLLSKILARHKRRHHLHGEKIFKCSTCGKSFDTKQRLERHAIHVHSNIRPFHCNHSGCNKSFKTATNLKQHKDFHGEPKYGCDTCGSMFRQKIVLRKHEKQCAG